MQFAKAITVVVVLLCSGIVSTTACTEAVIKDQCSDAVVSARTFSFATELSPQVTAGELLLV
jgi:penicillin V acylase-like amidase (Ntn superfamily)